MQLAVELNLLNNLAPVRLERRAEIVQRDAGELGHQPVRRAAGNLPRQPMVAPRHAPAAYQVVALLNSLQEFRNLRGIVLQVAVHGDNHFAAREVEPGLERRRLPEIPPQPHHIHPPVVLENIFEHFVGFVAAAVVHKNNFIGFAQPVHHFRQPHVQRGNVFLFVEERYDNGIANWAFTGHIVQ